MPNLTQFSESVAALLKQHEQTVAVAESSTGGLISAALLAVPGASAYYAGGSVIYTMQARKELLGISRVDVSGLEPLTEPMAARFANLARRQLQATWGLAELGAAGPTGTRYGHEPGISVIAVDGPVCLTVRLATGDNDRERNMWAFSAAAFELLNDAVTQAAQNTAN